MRTVTKAGHTDCRKHSLHCQKPLHYSYAITFLPRLAVPCSSGSFFLVSPATFVPWTPLLPPSLFPSPATDLLPFTSKGKFLCFPTTTLLAVRELLSGAIRSKTWARRRRRQSAHYSYHSTPSFLPALLHSLHTFHETKKTTNPLCGVIHMTHYLLVLYSLTPRLQSYNAITLSLIITLQQKELKLIPLFLLLLLLLLLFPPLPFSSLPCLLLPKPQLHISSFHGLYEKKKKTQSSLPLSLSLSHFSRAKLSLRRRRRRVTTDALLLLLRLRLRLLRVCCSCCSCLGTQTVPFFFFFPFFPFIYIFFIIINLYNYIL